MMALHPLLVTRKKLELHYGSETANAMIAGFERESCEDILGVLNWPGVGTRWERFLRWYTLHGRQIVAHEHSREQSPQRKNKPELAFAGFSRSLGRVVTYRALALTHAQLQRIFTHDNIFASGAVWGKDAETGQECLAEGQGGLVQVVDTHGVAKVAVCRLFMMQVGEIHQLLSNFVT